MKYNSPEALQKKVFEDKMEREKEKFWLSEKHHNAARIIVENNVLPRYKSGKVCRVCNNTRTLGTTPDENLFIPCNRCINTHIMKADWFAYCEKFPELKARFLC